MENTKQNTCVPSAVVILPTYNRLKLLKQAVRSVLDQTVKPKYFLILDNNCTDGSVEFLDELATSMDATGDGTKIEVFHSSKNLGASGGMRFLFEKAIVLKPDWIWIMDDDGLAFPNALEELLKSSEASDPEAYVLESAIVDEQGQWSPPNRPALFDPKGFRFEGLTEHAFETALKAGKGLRVQTGGYCGLLIRRQAFEEFGFPRTEFFLWYDDVEFILRVSMKKKVFLIPRSQIQHFAQALVPHEKKWPFSGPLPKIPERLLWRYYYLNRNWLWMAKQWLPAPKYAVFWAKHMARNLAAPVLFKQDRLIYRWSLAMKAGKDAILNRLGQRI